MVQVPLGSKAFGAAGLGLGAASRWELLGLGGGGGNLTARILSNPVGTSARARDALYITTYIFSFPNQVCVSVLIDFLSQNS